MPQTQAAAFEHTSVESAGTAQTAEIIDLGAYMTTSEAHKITGLSITTLARYASWGRIKGRRIGRDWLLERASVEAYAETWHKPGPKGPRTKIDGS